MGYRLHVAKTYSIHYDSSGFFNWEVEKVNRLISKYMPDAFFNEEFMDNTIKWEIPIKCFQEGLEKMKQETEPLLKDSDYTNKEVIEAFEHFYEKHDPENDYVILEWF